MFELRKEMQENSNYLKKYNHMSSFKTDSHNIVC